MNKKKRDIIIIVMITALIVSIVLMFLVFGPVRGEMVYGAGKVIESETNNPWLVLEKDTFQLNETIKFKFRPNTTENLYLKGGTGVTPWEIYIKEKNNWKQVIYNCEFLQMCGCYESVLRCAELRPVVGPYKRVSEEIFEWDQTQCNRERKRCGDEDYDFVESKLVDPGEYLVRICYYNINKTEESLWPKELNEQTFPICISKTFKINSVFNKQVHIKENGSVSNFTPIKTGVSGKVMLRTGNCMPIVCSKDSHCKQSCNVEGIETNVYIREIVPMEIWGNYTDESTEIIQPVHIIRKIRSNKDGYFVVELSPGDYSVFAGLSCSHKERCLEGIWKSCLKVFNECEIEECSYSDTIGDKSYPCPIIVVEGKVTEYNPLINLATD